MHTIYLTEKHIQELKKKKDCSAMAQVGGKVNSAIMSNITCGGMCEEGAGPESDEYEIGFEGDSNNEYAHVISESPDTVCGDMNIKFNDGETYPFVMLRVCDAKRRQDSYDFEGKIFASDKKGETHYMFINRLLTMGYEGDPNGIVYEPMVSTWLNYVDEYSGRYWKDRDIISFWEEPDNYRTLAKRVESVCNAFEKSGVEVDMKNLLIDVWNGISDTDNRIIPYRWLINGTAEMYLNDKSSVARPLKPNEYLNTHSYTWFKVLTDKYGALTIDINGNLKEEDAVSKYFRDLEDDEEDIMPAFSFRELNEEHSNGNILEKYIPSLLDFLSKKINIKPYPEIHLNDDEQEGLFIRTGYYEPDKKSVTLFTSNRHEKDILRSLAHELIHHYQNLNDSEKDWGGGGNLEDDDTLRKLEAEAYLKGNILFREWTEWMQGKEKHSLNENVSPNDIDLSSFEIKKELNPKFWKDGHLDSRIRMKLLDLADDFLKYMGLEWIEPEDVIMTGSLANYNWNKQYSDIDLHIMVDYKDVDENKTLVTNFFKAQKELWNNEHKDLKIFGFPVEIYVQDVNEKHDSTGIYSLDKDKWTTEPDRKKISSNKYSKENVRKKVAEYMNEIDEAEENYKDADSDYKLRKTDEKLDDIFSRLKKERKDGLNTLSKENSEGNITYKMLRRKNYIAKIFDLKTKIYDKMNSLT